MKLTTSGGFPGDGNVSIAVFLSGPERQTLKLRRSAWCRGMKIRINHVTETLCEGADGYFSVDRVWNNSDCIELELPMEYHTENLPGSDYQTFFYGPNLLAGTLPVSKMVDDPAKERFSDHLKARGKTDEFPPILLSEGPIVNPLDAQVIPYKRFKWIPLYQVYEEHYGVYFRVMNRAEWTGCEAELRIKAKTDLLLAQATVDEIAPGFQQSEVEHGLRETHTETGDFQHCKFRRVLPNGELSYELAVDPNKPMSLQVKFWGAEWQSTRLAFRIGTVLIGEQQMRTIHPGEWCVLTYPVPPELSAGERFIRLTICHIDGGDGGRIFHLRMIREQ